MGPANGLKGTLHDSKVPRMSSERPCLGREAAIFKRMTLKKGFDIGTKVAPSILQKEVNVH